MRPREVKRWLVAVGLGWIAAAGIATMPAAKADPQLSHAQIAYVQTYHSAVCKTIAKYPTEGGVAGILSVVMKDGFSPVDAANVVNAAVAVYCPEWWPLLQAIGDHARAQNSISDVVMS